MKTDKKTVRSNRTICLPFTEEDYNQTVHDASKFREYINVLIKDCSELFPSEIAHGYRMKDSSFSKKCKTLIRRIEINDRSYTIRPSYLMPYMTGYTKDIEKALFLRKFNVPFWAVSHVYGKDAMYWYRIETALGRNSILGTTIRKPEDIPRHIAADEKHTRILKK